MDSNKKENTVSEADRNKVIADREAQKEKKRLAKLAAKQKQQDKNRNLPNAGSQQPEPSVEQPKAKENVEHAKQAPVTQKTERRKDQKPTTNTKPNEVKAIETVTKELDNLKIAADKVEKDEKKPLTKAERRAIQEAQRAAKATKATKAPEKSASSAKSSDAVTTKTKVSSAKTKVKTTSKEPTPERKLAVHKIPQHRVKLFNHLYKPALPIDIINSDTIHPSILRLGAQYSSGIVKGSNARVLAFLNAIKTVIEEYETPSQKEFSRSLEDAIKACGNYLQQCRPLAVSVTNAIKYIQLQIRQLPKDESEAEVN